jgi:hypothetical protein
MPYADKNKAKEMARLYRARPEVSEKLRIQKRIWKQKNKEKIKIASKEYRSRPEVKDKAKEIYLLKRGTQEYKAVRAAWRKKKSQDPEYVAKCREYHSKRLRLMPKHSNENIARNLRRRMREVVDKNYRNSILNTLLGCTVDEFKQYIQSKFKEGMAWNNYGYRGWHIDHIIPCAKFDLTNPKEQEKCFHYTNMQPLWAYENISKSDKVLV